MRQPYWMCRYLPDIIGKGGVNIRAIQESLQVKLTIPQTPTTSSSGAVGNVKIHVSGMKDNVIKTKALIKELMLYYHTSLTHPGLVHEELDVPTNYYNYIIGAKGSEIKHIQANFKVNVHIPSVDSINKNVVVVGLPNNVESAKKYILKIIDNVIQGKRPSDKVKTVTEEDVVDAPVDDLEPRVHDVSIVDLLQTAKHVPAGHSVAHIPSESNGQVVEPVEPPVIHEVKQSGWVTAASAAKATAW